MKKLHVLASSVAMMAFAGSANAQQGFGTTMDNLRSGFLGPMGDFLLAISFICGVVSAIVCITVLWKNSRNNHDPNASPVAAFKWGAAAAALLALPVFMGLSVDTFFGDGGTAARSSIDGTLREVQ
ncbi:SH3 domain-containing protein [Aureimonas ureilytica]|uniref:hypothetical protein n=1 Tax=Aureimonas ureilytica TaxID=401562 RepID=UPI000372A9A8|nr:hypothetical protein [Aureimonas ureilytica]